MLVPKFGYSQVGINTTTPNAQLDIRSSNQVTPSNNDGILIPKIDAFPATNPTTAQNSMMVYLTTLSAGKQPGFIIGIMLQRVGEVLVVIQAGV